MVRFDDDANVEHDNRDTGDLDGLFSFSFFYDRFAVSFISWSVSFSAPVLGGSTYVNVVLTAVAALPAYPISAALTLR